MRPLLPLLALCCLGVAACADEVVHRWDFDADAAGWRPRADSITVERDETVRRGDAGGSLRVHGDIDVGWNYAISDRRPLTPGTLYRLSAWLRVDSVGERTPAPFLKCELVGTDNEALGRPGTTAYDLRRLGEWQELTVEFAAPDGIDHAWLALEKGTDGACSLNAWLDDVTLSSIDELSIVSRYRLDPLPPQLEAVRGRHPRLYLTPERADALRAAIETTHAGIWAEQKARADRLVASGPPAYREHDSYSGDEQLWQREVGNAMPQVALAWVLTGDRKYLDSAEAWALASCAYPTWGLKRIDGMDLAAGHQLFGLAMVYDWCYDDLSESARQTIRETFARRGQAMFDAALAGTAWWDDSYLQNHLWVSTCGLAAAGLAVFDEVDGASDWVGLTLDKWRTTMASLGADGASHEGHGYWQYGAEYLLKFMELARDLLGVDMYDTPWFRNTAHYAQCLFIPRNAWTSRSVLVDIADCPRNNWYGPDYILWRLAAEYRDGQAQATARALDAADVAAGGAPWLNLLWYDPTLPDADPAELPTLTHFDDMGIVAARSDWSGDEALVVFKNGPFIGHHAMDVFRHDPGGGHVHPDAGQVLVFAKGEWLLRDDGYAAKWTAHHNTLLVDGKGQIGEGRTWFNGGEALAADSRPTIPRADSAPAFDVIVGDVTDAYPEASGLTRFVRTLVFCKPDVLLLFDDIATAGARPLELRFFPEHAATAAGDAFVATGERAALRLEPLTREGLRVRAEPVPLNDRHGGEGDPRPAIRLQRTADRWQNVTAVSWSAAGAEPVAARHARDGSVSAVEVGDRKVRFDWATGEVETEAE